MSEWVKAALSVLSGVLIGVCAEPLKQAVMLRVTTRRCKSAIYTELGWAYHIAEVFAASDVLKAENAGRIAFDEYDFYYESHREAFYRLPHHAQIRGLYNGMKLTIEQCAAGKLKPRVAMLDMKNNIESAMELGYLDARENPEHCGCLS